MNRIIKFRAWDYRNKRMISWGKLISSKELLQSFFGNEHYVTNPPRYFYERMQFTGLYDCEGKEIYEEDVIEYTQHHFNTELIKVKRKIVKWNYDRWNIYETAAGETDVKLIGNIYEHPNLLNNESNT